MVDGILQCKAPQSLRSDFLMKFKSLFTDEDNIMRPSMFIIYKAEAPFVFDQRK